MKIKHPLMAAVVALAILATFACGSAATPVSSTPTPGATTPADDSPQAPFASSIVGTPVPRSDVETAFDKPLSSGLSVADVVENALPSVVHIIAGSGTGTGFIINEDGLVVTNKHVVEGNSQVAVRLVTGNEYRGNVTQRHPDLDLAYIEIDATPSFTPIAIGDSDKIRVGEDVIAIGFPLGRSLGLEPTVSVGIISAKRDNRLQTDASLNPGNSGGPLLDMFGQVAGVVVSRVETDSSGRPVAGIGFAIPINTVNSGLGGQVSPAGKVLPTPFPTIGPTPDLEATKAAIDAIDAAPASSGTGRNLFRLGRDGVWRGWIVGLGRGCVLGGARVPNKEARMLLVSLPRSERVPPLIFRLTTGGRRLRSAALLSALARGSATKVNSSGREAFHPLAQHPHGRIAAQVRLTDGP